MNPAEVILRSRDTAAVALALAQPDAGAGLAGLRTGYNMVVSMTIVFNGFAVRFADLDEGAKQAVTHLLVTGPSDPVRMSVSPGDADTLFQEVAELLWNSPSRH